MTTQAEAANLPLRLLGGLAIHLRGDRRQHALLGRPYKDIDVITYRSHRKQLAMFMDRMDYVADREFNTLHGDSRLLYWDDAHERQLDVFLDKFDLCHVVPIAQRLLQDPLTIPLAELLLTKLQIVELNEKDQRDIVALFYANDVGDSDGDRINASIAAKLCAADWGLWRTATASLQRVYGAVDSYPLTSTEKALVRNRMDLIRKRLEDEPKTRRWRIRARVGDRVRWYEEPDEVV